MYQFKVSTRKNKKYDVYKNNKYIVSFGDKNYEHFEDKTPVKYYSTLNHYDEKRRQSYYKRFGNNPNFESAMYFSHKYLW
jgi:hypothetical protein